MCVGLLALMWLLRHNRLLFWCLGVALLLHFAAFATLGIISYLNWKNRKPNEIRIEITRLPPQPIPPSKEKPKPTPPPPIRPDPRELLRKLKTMPKGTTTKTKISGKSGKKGAAGPKPKLPQPARIATNIKAGGRPKTGKVLTTPGAGPNSVPVDPDAKMSDGLGTGTRMGSSDFIGKGIGSGTEAGDQGSGEGGEGGEGGENFGTRNGSDIPRGFMEGKINGRVYFIRLKHGSGAWNAFSAGTRRLLQFLNNTSFRAETEGRAMTASELQSRFMRRGAQPTFLYIYCDASFKLTQAEVNILRTYVSKGGFLFLDSRPDSEIKTLVAKELDKVLPGTRLTALTNNHPINSFLFRLSAPGVGENFIDKKNYGVTRNGRLTVFYTMGNLSHFFETNDPKSVEYATAQYQMGANVMVYAIRKGNSRDITKLRGANARITTQALEKLGFLEKKPSSVTKKKVVPVTVKIRKPTGSKTKPGVVPKEPDEIKVLD